MTDNKEPCGIDDDSLLDSALVDERSNSFPVGNLNRTETQKKWYREPFHRQVFHKFSFWKISI